MRMLFSVLALLVVAAVVMKLAATQLQTLKPAPTTGGATAGAPASPAAQQAQRAADLVTKALQQGAAAASAP